MSVSEWFGQKCRQRQYQMPYHVVAQRPSYSETSNTMLHSIQYTAAEISFNVLIRQTLSFCKDKTKQSICTCIFLQSSPKHLHLKELLNDKPKTDNKTNYNSIKLQKQIFVMRACKLTKATSHKNLHVGHV